MPSNIRLGKKNVVAYFYYSVNYKRRVFYCTYQLWVYFLAAKYNGHIFSFVNRPPGTLTNVTEDKGRGTNQAKIALKYEDRQVGPQLDLPNPGFAKLFSIFHNLFWYYTFMGPLLQNFLQLKILMFIISWSFLTDRPLQSSQMFVSNAVA